MPIKERGISDGRETKTRIILSANQLLGHEHGEGEMTTAAYGVKVGVQKTEAKSCF